MARSIGLPVQLRRRGGASLENPRELLILDVPHILGKLTVRPLLLSESQSLQERIISLKIASDCGLGFMRTKKKSCCQRPVVETFARGAELLRRWGRCLEARVAD